MLDCKNPVKYLAGLPGVTSFVKHMFTALLGKGIKYSNWSKWAINMFQCCPLYDSGLFVSTSFGFQLYLLLTKLGSLTSEIQIKLRQHVHKTRCSRILHKNCSVIVILNFPISYKFRAKWLRTCINTAFTSAIATWLYTYFF